MTRRATFLQSDVRRAIEAARKAGLRVVAIKPDGTVVLSDAEAPIVPLHIAALDVTETPINKWSKVRA